MQRHRRLLSTAILAGLGLAAAPFGTAAAQPQPFQDDPPRYRSNRPYGRETTESPRPAPGRRDESVATEEPAEPRTQRETTVRVDRRAPRSRRSAEAREDAATRRGVSFHATAAAGGRPGAAAAVANAENVAGTSGNAPAISLRGGVDFPSQYFFRGYMRTGGGWTVQPFATLAWTAYRSEDDSLSLTPHVGAWISWGEEQGPDSPHHFQELDLTGGVAVGLGDLSLDFQYVFYESPAELFQAFHEVGVDVTYDDSRFWPARGPITALNPSLALFYQLQDDNDDDYNTYVGLGLEPTCRAFDVANLPVSVSFPLTLGGSYDGYYKDDDGHNANAGFWSAGIKAGLPLGRGGYGIRWYLDAEVDYVRLLADSAQNGNEGDGDDVVFRVGLRLK